MTRVIQRSTRPTPLNTSTEVYDPQFLAAILGQSVNPVYVSEQSIGGLPAIGRGVDLIAHAVATMLTSADVVSTAGNPVETPAVVSRPNLLFGTYEFWHMVVTALMMRGNYVGIKADYDDNGLPNQVVPISPEMVQLKMDTGIPVYRIDNHEYPWEDIVHIRSHAPTGQLWGRGIIERYRTELTGQLHQQQYGSNSWSSGGVPSAVIQLDTPNVTPTKAEEIQSQWIARHGYGQRKPAVIGKALSITPLSWSPEDAQYVESAKLSIAQCALITGLRPEDLGASIGGSALSYGNRATDAIQRILDSYSPWLNLIEQAWSDLVAGDNRVIGNAESLLRTTTKERYELYQLGLSIGVYDEDEIRGLEHKPPRDKKPELAIVANMPALTQGESA